ncbi:hypothetical protein T12_6931 [Trichinella patagoniensis]|uniref:Uncharacterized protein n=1 Tax=Trichinella patagoniensis TaxID=990121 RepID=A0A0V0YYD3_9BILA|nr:hypothetical protein T12_6931 [Trichinella patagoniensis]
MQRLVAGIILPFDLSSSRYKRGVIREVGLFCKWSFKRSKALKTFIKKVVTEIWFMHQKYIHLDTH